MAKTVGGTPALPASVDLIGTGRLASALAGWMRPLPAARTAWRPRLGILVSRDARRARRLARRWGARRGMALADYAPEAPTLLLAVPDDALGPLATELARRAGPGSARQPWWGRVVLHTSGLQPAAVLAPLRARGAAMGSLHPLMTFGTRRPVPSPRDLVFAIEGQPAALRRARQLVRAWGGRPLPLKAREKTLYHLAATWASPLMVANFAIAADLLRRAGLRGRRLAVARSGLARLTAQTAANLAAAQADLTAAWTGPMARGDRQTISRHLAVAGKSAGAYRALARAAARLL